MPNHSLFRVFLPVTLAFGGCLDAAVYESEVGSETGAESTGTSGYETWPGVLTTTEGAPDEDESSGGAATTGGTFAECEPGEVDACAYGGPPETQGVGACRAGARTCGEGGVWGSCVGEVVPAAEDCRSEVDEDCDGRAACDGEVVWVRGFGEEKGGAPGAVTVSSISVDAAGRAWIVGQFSESLQLGEQTWRAQYLSSFMMVGIDGDGAPMYSFGDEQVGAFGRGHEVATGGGSRLAIAAGNQGPTQIHAESASYTSNQSTSAGVVGVMTTAGEYLWSRALRPEHDASVSIRGLAFDGAGNLWVGGNFGYGDLAIGTNDKPAVLANHGGVDAFLIRMTAEGEIAWSVGYGDAQSQSINDIAIDPDGNVWLVGGFAGKLEFSGNSLFSSANQDMFIVKLDANGVWQWGRSYGDTNGQSFYGIEIDRHGNAVVVGQYSGTIADLGPEVLVEEGLGSKPVVAKFAPDGAVLWARDWTCHGSCSASGVAVDATGQSVAVLTYGWEDTIVIDGKTIAGAPDESSAIVVKLDRDGGMVWASDRVPGAPELAVDALGGVFLASDFKTYAKFGSDKTQLYAGPADSDLYVLKLRP